MVVCVNLRRIAMDVYDLLVTLRIDLYGIELLHVIADAKNHIGLIEAEVGVVVDHESYRTERVGVVVGKDPLTHERRRNRDVKTLRETNQRFTRMITHGSVSRKEDGTLRSLHDFRGTRYLNGSGRGIAHHIDI